MATTEKMINRKRCDEKLAWMDVKFNDSSCERVVKSVRGLLEEVQQVDAHPLDEDLKLKFLRSDFVAYRSKFSDHRWNDLLNNAFLSLDCLEAMLLARDFSEAEKVRPVTARSLAAIGLKRFKQAACVC